MPMQQKGSIPPEYTERFSEDRLGFIIGVRKKLVRLADLDAGPPPAGAGTRWGVPLVRTETEASPEAGFGVVRYYYEGLMTQKQVHVYEIDASFEEVPLQAHPRFKQLFKKYGGYYTANGNLRWATSDDGSVSNGLTVTSAADGKTLAGVDAYFRMGAVVRKISSYKNFPAAAFRGIGLIGSPDGDVPLPPTAGARNYLKAPPKARFRGNAWEVTQEWIMSGAGGWIKDIYDGSIES